MIRCCIALLLLAPVTLSSGQDQGERDYSLTVDVELVQLPVSVFDKQGLPVRGLQREHFTVYEDKVPQNISVFKQEDIPLSVGLVIDASGSMIDKLDRLSTAAMTFVKESNPEDETSVVSFGEDVFLEQDFTQNANELRRVVKKIHPDGATPLYDAVILAAKYLQEKAAHEKKVLLVVSDGEDNSSKYDLKEALKAVSQRKIIVYTVGLLSNDSIYGTYSDTGKKALKQLADGTGGASFFPKQMSEVEQICRKVARDLRNQYTIGYRPSNQNLDGSWRKVVVRLNATKEMPNFKIQTKPGYYAPVIRRQAAQESTVK